MFFFRFGKALLLTYVIIISACQSPAEIEEPDYLDELEELVDRYVGDNTVLTLGTDEPELLKDASAVGRTSRGLPYAQFIDKEAWLMTATVAYLSLNKTSGILDEVESCLLEDGAGALRIRRFLKCVQNNVERGVCMLVEQQRNGDIYAQPWECPPE